MTRLWLKIQSDRAVVRAFNETVYLTRVKNRLETMTRDHIVQAPTDILFPCTASVTPPRICHFVWMHFPPYVMEAATVQNIGETIDFVLCVTRCFVVIGSRTSKVNGLMGNLMVLETLLINMVCTKVTFQMAKSMEMVNSITQTMLFSSKNGKMVL